MQWADVQDKLCKLWIIQHWPGYQSLKLSWFQSRGLGSSCRIFFLTVLEVRAPVPLGKVLMVSSGANSVLEYVCALAWNSSPIHLKQKGYHLFLTWTYLSELSYWIWYSSHVMLLSYSQILPYSFYDHLLKELFDSLRAGNSWFYYFWASLNNFLWFCTAISVFCSEFSDCVLLCLGVS